MLESIWFALWGVLWAVYFMLDGFDLGLGTLMPVLAKNEMERRVIYQSIGPFWDGNEVWLITAGGVTFAAFPTVYAVMFSGLYSALMLILFALIFRGVSIEFRGKIEDPRWKAAWDVCFTVGSFLPALLFGVAFANIFQGIPIDGKGVFHGTLLSLLNPSGLLGGVFFVMLFLVHGALWLAAKAEAPLLDRAGSVAAKWWPKLFIVAVAFLVATWYFTKLYDNYLHNPLHVAIPFLLIPLLAVGALVMTRIFIARRRWWKAWFASSVTIIGVTLFGVVGLYPNLLPSSLNRAYSLTAFNSASSPLTLKIMLIVALTFIPIVIVYQAWAYSLFREKIHTEESTNETAY